MTKHTPQYAAYLAWQRNIDIKKKNELYQEAQSWKSQKHSGRADICFDLYGELKARLAAGLDHFRYVTKSCQIKPIFGNDYVIIGFEQRVNGKWTTIAKDEKDIQRMGEDFVVESIILGGDDEGSSKSTP